MVINNLMKFSTVLLTLILAFVLSSNSALASVHITNFSGTTKASTNSAPKNYHHFYSSKKTINVKFKVNKFVKTHKNKRVYIQVQKDNGLWWSTKTTKSVTNTRQISFNVDGGTGDYRIVVYDAPERTGWDKPPLYYAKSTQYSGAVKGL
ncbi:hypothetical protein [Bacillus xiapuensis]|uniref:hypothetical protein n=1 Tax=Bacillus xiapuensis TaxID=2014075 RepID=UPI000C236BBD|nr:hypothetical protein [Bacillus xiapuensis]